MIMLAQHNSLIFLKNKIQTSKINAFVSVYVWIKCRMYLKKEFEAVKWLPIKKIYNQCVNLIAFKYFKNQYAHHLD